MSKDLRETGKDTGTELEKLANALRFEKAKNKVLLDEVLGLEDEIVNRELESFGDAVQEDTRDFWRDQLLQNRSQAKVALGQMKELQAALTAKPAAVENGKPRPLHNRMTSRPVVQQGATGTAAPVDDGKAGLIRNRAHEIRKQDGVPFSVAFRRAEREVQGTPRD